MSDLARLLLEGRRAKDYTPLLGYLRGLTPSKLDGELREMQVQHSISWPAIMLSFISAAEHVQKDTVQQA